MESNDKEAADKLGDLFKNNNIKIDVENEESVSVNDDVCDFRKAKEEMNKLGFKDYNEYLSISFSETWCNINVIFCDVNYVNLFNGQKL